jgi:hypothetical protein
MQEGRSWDDEVASRLESLKCRVCGGANPYVCACAKQAFLKKQRPKKRAKLALSSDRIEDEWRKYKREISPSTVICTKCDSKEWQSYCPCAKKQWLEWRSAQ